MTHKHFKINLYGKAYVMLSDLLTNHKGNLVQASKEFKMDRRNFCRLLKRYGINAQDFRGI